MLTLTAMTQELRASADKVHAGCQTGTSNDPELAELQAAYQPAMWMPDKVDSVECAWSMHVDAHGATSPDRTDEELKKAVQKFNQSAVSVRNSAAIQLLANVRWNNLCLVSIDNTCLAPCICVSTLKE